MENRNEAFKKYYSRLAFEAILKSAIIGLIIGFSVNFLVAGVSWFFGFDGLWIAIGVGVGVAVGVGILCYFIKYRPTTKDIAKRVDRLGLEERLITMLELESDESYIAMRQREDAKNRIKEVNRNRIVIRLSKVLVAVAIVAVALGVSMTTLVALAEEDIIPSGSDIINPDPLKEYIAVSYLAEEGGEIDGESDQLILPGEDCQPVTAVASDGWVFVGWEDGFKSPGRQDLGVSEGFTVSALFQEIEDGGEGDDSEKEGQGNGEQEGDKADDVPNGGEAEVDSDQTGNAENGSGEGNDGNSDGAKGEGDQEGEGKGDGQGLGAGGKWEDSNQIIDGETYYQEVIEQYYEWAMQIIAEGGEIPEELREFIEKYYDSI